MCNPFSLDLAALSLVLGPLRKNPPPPLPLPLFPSPPKGPPQEGALRGEGKRGRGRGGGSFLGLAQDHAWGIPLLNLVLDQYSI